MVTYSVQFSPVSKVLLVPMDLVFVKFYQPFVVIDCSDLLWYNRNRYQLFSKNS